ncbi:hypothetical protein K470DRAFT_291976 [Piedraia hortae CBS 480.64]|uniref:Uncharacterized protein n=1 Tax=Piedraia hortae CBS 480.64 TaxID=1314780 RepID=A0A6A7CB16_9PEZI|nr:hypothetical protein K470DRAFT_291976 [Piedraia hortae CBS 480.64]
MSKSYVYLSGPRSLEYFVPGSSSEDSDWDFYVPHSPEHKGELILALQGLGVHWLGRKDEILAVALGEDGGTMKIEYESLVYPRRNGSLNYITQLTGLQFTWAASELARDCKVLLSVEKIGDELWVSKSDRCDYYSGLDLFYLLRGSLTYRKKTMPVQLMIDNRINKATYRVPLKLHSSCVQSFIGAHCACYMYDELASRCESYAWVDHENNADTKLERSGLLLGWVPDPVQSMYKKQWYLGWFKYRTGGYKCVEAEEADKREPRNCGDAASTWVEYLDPVPSAPQSVFSYYIRANQQLAWDDENLVRTIQTNLDGQIDKPLGIPELDEWLKRTDRREAERLLDHYVPIRRNLSPWSYRQIH